MQQKVLENTATRTNRPAYASAIVASILFAVTVIGTTTPFAAQAQQPPAQRKKAENAQRPGNKAQRQAAGRRGPQRSDESPQRVRAQRKSATAGEQPGHSRRPTRARIRALIAFRPAPEDYGPLREGEKEELLRFARRHVPSVYNLLSDIRDKNPRAFSRHLQEAVPRLRALRRVFKLNARLGQMIVQHAENDMAIRLGGRVWPNATPEQREIIERKWRKRLASNAQLEARAAEQRLAQMEKDRDDLIAADMAALLAAEDNLPGETPAVRRLVAAIHNSEDDKTRQAHKDRLRNLLAEQFDQDVAAGRERLAEFRKNMKDEVDRRLQRTIEQAKNRPAKPQKGESQ